MGIDRSEKMIEAARRRNESVNGAGKVDLIRASFPQLDLGERHFTNIFAIHVPLFRNDRATALTALERLLAPEGTVYLIGQPLREDNVEPWVDATVSHFLAGGFSVLEPRFSGHQPVRTACVSVMLRGPYPS